MPSLVLGCICCRMQDVTRCEVTVSALCSISAMDASPVHGLSEIRLTSVSATFIDSGLLMLAVAESKGTLDSFVSSVAKASVQAASTNVQAAAASLAETAVQATKKGVTEQFAASQAQAFAAANQDNNVASYAVAVAEAIQKGGESATKAYASAFAKAAASGGEQAAGLAQAIAVVSCEGGYRAEAFAEALSQSISINKQGCTILTEARATAYARCGPEGAFSSATSSVAAKVLGMCGLSPDPKPVQSNTPAADTAGQGQGQGPPASAAGFGEWPKFPLSGLLDFKFPSISPFPSLLGAKLPGNK